MTDDIFVAILGNYLFAITLGITIGGIFALALLLFRHRRSSAYNLDV